jgi:CDP-glucose 4,6-dehydratase
MSDSESFWQDRRVFITGCTGLVGAWTVRALLEHGAHVIGLVRDHIPDCELMRGGLFDRMDVVRGSVEDYPLVERSLLEYEVQTVIHLAAQTIVGTADRGPLFTFESNIKGTWCLLEAARRCGTRPEVIVASSDKAYGAQQSLPYTEESPLLARNPYDASKLCADVLARTYAHTYRLPVCVTRCGNFFGGGDLNWSRIVPGTVRALLRGQRPVLRSDGTCLRDYFYVKDGAAAYLHLAEFLSRRPEHSGHAFNFSTEMPLTVLQVVERILNIFGSDLTPDIRAEARGEIPRQYLSAAKARRMLGWTPRYELDEALRETVAWYRDYFTTVESVANHRAA